VEDAVVVDVLVSVEVEVEVSVVAVSLKKKEVEVVVCVDVTVVVGVAKSILKKVAINPMAKPLSGMTLIMYWESETLRIKWFAVAKKVSYEGDPRCCSCTQMSTVKKSLFMDMCTQVILICSVVPSIGKASKMSFAFCSTLRRINFCVATRGKSEN
jgi:hypothetical protein